MTNCRRRSLISACVTILVLLASTACATRSRDTTARFNAVLSATIEAPRYHVEIVFSEGSRHAAIHVDRIGSNVRTVSPPSDEVVQIGRIIYESSPGRRGFYTRDVAPSIELART